MIIQKFEDIIAWQKAKLLTIKIRLIFGDLKDYSFRDQIFRASLSISNNIAEGFDRNSDKELNNFLHIARGSNSEVKSMLLIAKDLNYIKLKDHIELIKLSDEVAKTITGFIKSLTTKD